MSHTTDNCGIYWVHF